MSELPPKSASIAELEAGIARHQVVHQRLSDAKRSLDQELLRFRAIQQYVERAASDEFIRRFLIHVLPSGFHRIRHYGLFANGGRTENLARVRELLAVPPPHDQPDDVDASADEPPTSLLPCPCCGGRMIIIETFERGSTPRTRPPSPIRIDTS